LVPRGAFYAETGAVVTHYADLDSRLRIAMRKKISGIISLGGAALWWLLRESIKALFFDRVIHVIDPIAGYFIEYGPPLALAAFGGWLLWPPSRKTGLSIETDAGDAKPIPDMLVKEAAQHLAATKASWDEVWAELRQAARDGRITVWGRPESAHLERPYKPMEEIPSDHWRHYAFDFFRCMHSEDAARCRSEPDDPKRYPLNKGYADLRVNTTQVRTSWIAKIPSNALTIEISDGAPFNTYTKELYTKTHLIRIGIVNGIYDRAVTNCQLRLEQITGPFSDQCPVTIKQNFTINGGAREYIPFVEFDERIDKDRPAPSKPGLIRLYFPLTRPLSNRISYLDAGSYELTLLATSAETPPARQKCRLVLEDGLLSLQRL
jgi:hypothetical protein